MNQSINKSLELSRNKAAIVAAIGLIGNIIFAVVALMMIPEIITNGDIAAVISDIIASEQQFRLAICLLVLNVIADIIVFWALYYFLRPISNSLSLLAVLFGIMHAVVGLSAVNNLTNILHMIDITASGSMVSADMFQLQAATMISAFHWAWQAGMVMFGVHLIFRGCLLFKAGYMKKWLGVIILVVAAGYLVDGFGQILISGYDSLSGYVGALEAVLVIWLLVKGRKIENV